MRLAVLGLAAALAVSVAPAAVALPREEAIGGRWTLTFTPTSVRTVGQMLRGDVDIHCDGGCQSQYKFSEPGVTGNSTTLYLDLADAGCAAPCDVPAKPESGTGFTGIAHWDGSSYTLEGRGFETSVTTTCPRLIPEDGDTGSFTVSGSGRDARLEGTLTVLLGWTATNDCLRLVGYEMYTGTFTGTRIGFFPSAQASVPAGSTAVPGAGAGVGSGSDSDVRAFPADRLAAARHSRPSLSTGVAGARSLPWRPTAVLVSALLALVLVLLMPFPAALFNATLEAHYDEVRGWFRFVPRRPPPDPDALVAPSRRWRDFGLVVGAAAVLNAFLDPHLKLDRASFVLVLGLALSIAAVSLLAAVPARAYMRRAYQDRAHVKMLPLGLAVGALCVLVSRISGFEPGYLYGVVAGFAFTRELAGGEKGRVEFVTSAFLLVVAVAAFVARIPVHDATLRSDAVPLALLDTVLAAVFAAGVEANVLGLLPLRFLPGEAVLAWRRAAWMAAFGFSLFAFLHALAAEAGQARTAASVAVAAALFLGFGAVSVTFWAYFRFRPQHPTPASV